MKRLLLFLILHFLFCSSHALAINPGKDRLTLLKEGRMRFQSRLLADFNRNKQQQRLLIAPFYLEEFASGIPSGWSNIDSAGSGRTWRASNNACGLCDALYIGTGVDSLSVIGTSSANGIVMYDSDSSQASIGGDYGVLISPAINCSGRSTVELSFNELFVYCNDLINPAYQNTARVYVSNNNVNWTLVHSADAGLAICGDATANPNPVTVDISGIAANQSTVYVRFTYTGDYGYWWFIDDVALTQPFPYEAELVSIEPITNGCQLTNSQPVTITIRNNGSQTISNFPVSYSINGSAPVTETISSPLARNATLNYTFNQTADFSNTGAYTLAASVNLNNDAFTINDQDTIQVVCSSPSITLPYFNGFESSADYDGGILWDWDGDGVRPVRSSSGAFSGNYCLEFPATASGTSYDKWFFLPCMDLLSGSGGSDYVVYFETNFSSVSSAGVLRSYICTGIDPSDTLLNLQNCIAAPATVYQGQACVFSVPQSGTYHIAFRYTGYLVQSILRLDDIGIDITVGLSDTDADARNIIYPNPNDGTFQIRLGSSSGPYRLIVNDATGSEILNRSCDSAMAEEVDMSAAPGGIYFVRLLSEKWSLTKRISVNK